VTAAAAVALTLVLNTILVPVPGHEINPSAWSRAFGPPQVAGILSSIAFSPNGKTLAAGASGGLKSGSQAKGTTYLLNVNSGKRTQTLGPGGGAEAFSPDGVMLATAGGPHNSATYLWNVDSGGKKIATLNDHHGSSVESVSFSPDGKMLATNDRNGVVYLWRLPRGERTTSVSAPGVVSTPGGPNFDAVAFSPRGTMLAMGGSDGQAYLFNPARPANTRTLSTPDSSGVTSVAFSQGGGLLAASEMDGMTYVWNLDSRSRISLDDPDGSVIESVAFSPNGRWLATGDANGNTYLWNLAAKKNKNKPAKSLANPKSPAAPSVAGNAVFSVAFGPDSNTLATTDTNGHIYLWPVH
jgi:WD40 repeat protein